jgi:DNA-binding winged helix-turn-helix (wHTH) protein/TolB-like protein/Flp pilus assembly protein TadD
VFDTLVVLLERAGHLVSKSDLMAAVWPNHFVEDGNVAVTISMLRKALGDEGPEHTYIKTVPGKGYRFIGEVREADASLRELSRDEPARKEPELRLAEIALPEIVLPVAARLRLRRTAFLVAAVMVTVVIASVLATRYFQHEGTARPKIASLAVLPFRSPNLDPTHDYLRVGIADAIITRLAAAGDLIVRPTTAVMDYTNPTADPVRIGRAQKVEAVLTGSIEVLSEKVRVNVQLVRVADSSMIWAGSFEGSADKMFDLEHDVEDKVAQAVSVRLPGQEQTRSVGMTTPNAEAYRFYLEGRYFWNKRTEQGLRRSIESFQRATIEDQQYAPAYAGLADSYALLASYGVEPAQQACPNAKAAALKALQLDEKLPESHTSMGMSSFYCEWNWQQAEQEFRRSIELNPNYPLAHTWYALELSALGRPSEAMAQIQSAYRLDPMSLSINTEIGRVYYWDRQYDRAVEAFRKAIDLDPKFARAHTRLGLALAAKKDFAGALVEFEQAQTLSDPDAYLDGFIGYVQGASGNSAAARKTLLDLASRENRQFVPAFSRALISLGLGDRNGAMEWFSRSYQDRSTYMVYAKADPLLDSIRSDPRFGDLLRHMGLL